MNNFDYIEYRLKFDHAISLPTTMSVDAYPVLHSDWLYRVFSSAWKRLLNVELPLDKLRISSGFPYFQDDSQVLNYVKSEEEFYPISLQSLQKNVVKYGTSCWRFQVRPRASFSKTNQRRQKRFGTSEIFFKQNAGVWLGARFADAEIRKNFEAVLRFIGDEGIGSSRSAGYGGFSILQSTEIKFDISENYSLLCLSRFIPKQADLTENFIRQVKPIKQDISQEVDGKIQPKEFLTFGEGSLLNNVEKFENFRAGEIIVEPDEKQRKHVGFLFAIPVSNSIYE